MNKEIKKMVGHFSEKYGADFYVITIWLPEEYKMQGTCREIPGGFKSYDAEMFQNTEKYNDIEIKLILHVEED